MEYGKKPYYVSVQSNTILEDASVPHEFEIYATEEEVERLSELLFYKGEADDTTFARAFIPFMEYHHDRQNDLYDAGLINVYRYLYEIGSAQTRQHIEQMGIL